MALGPGIIWMALAQGSGELIWWPYIVAKYGLGLLFLLVPACLLTMPLTEPGPLILLSALIGFLGTTTFAWLLYWLNHRYLPTVMPASACPQRGAALGLWIAGVAYGLLAAAYVWVRVTA